MKGIILGLSLSAIAVSAFAQTAVEASKTSPMPNPPQFIVLGSDDNTMARGVEWMQGVLDAGTNKDGTKRRMSFYVNTRNGGGNWSSNKELVNAVYNAYKAGHEIGNHTASHPYMVPYAPNEDKRMSLDAIRAEITEARDVMNANGIPAEHHFGFRTPYLRYSDSTFTIVKEMGFLYDVSISATSSNEAGSAYFPYTLDAEADENGNVSPDNIDNPDRPVRKHSGLWVIPCSRIEVAPQDLEAVGKETVTGLDYNLWANSDAALDSAQTINALMHTLQKHLDGNRAPFTLGIHSQYYFESKSEFPNVKTAQTRRIFEEFVKRASQLEYVFFVSSDMVIRWMLNPVSAADFDPEDYIRPAFSQITPPIEISLSNTRVDEGNLTVGNLTVINLNIDLQHQIEIIEGADKFEVVENTVKFKSQQPVGKYALTIKATSAGGSIDREFTISVNKVLIDNIIVPLTGWSKSIDSKSDVTIGNQDGALTLEIELAETDGVNWPYAGATRTVGVLTGVKGIEITYTADRNFTVGVGYWSPNLGFGFNAPIQSSQTQKTVVIPIEELTKTYSDAKEDGIPRDPSSIYDALDFTGLYVQLAANTYGETTNLKVYSLKFRADAVSITNPGIKNNRQRAISLGGISASRLNLNVAQAGVYSVDIFSVNGKQLFTTKTTLSAGRNQISMPKNLAKGVAIIRVSGLNAKVEQKMLIK
jgi:hypothetical protein